METKITGYSVTVYKYLAMPVYRELKTRRDAFLFANSCKRLAPECDPVVFQNRLDVTNNTAHIHEWSASEGRFLNT